MASDPYSTLGVPKSATEADIKKAYRKLAKELHPDTNQNNPKAADRFAKVTQAYDLLSDKAKRGQFDRGEIDGDGNPSFAGFGGGGGNPFGGGGNPFGGRSGGFGGQTAGFDMGDIFDGLFGGAAGKGGGFGGQRQPPQRGANTAYRLNVPFEDAATLKPQRITLRDGKTIDLKLPAGVETGTQMKLSGKGEAGPGGAGDGIVTIHVANHRFFAREGNDIRLSLPITLSEAVKGGAIKVPTVDGAVMLKIPAGANSGQVMRLKGKGFSAKAGTRGDQLVTLLVDLPVGDAQLSEFAESWTDSRNPREGLGV